MPNTAEHTSPLLTPMSSSTTPSTSGVTDGTDDRPPPLRRQGRDALPRQNTFGNMGPGAFGPTTSRNATAQRNVDGSETVTLNSSNTVLFCFHSPYQWLDCGTIIYMTMTVIMLACGVIVLGSMPDVSEYKTDDANLIVVHRSRLRRYWKAIDNTAILYLMTLSFLIAVICVAVVSLVKQYTDPESKEARDAAQMWIVGPIFLVSAVMVGIKTVTHIHKRLHPPSFTFVNGRMDAESLHGKSSETRSQSDTDSLRLVTITVPPQGPPTYEEMMESRRQWDEVEDRPTSASDLRHVESTIEFEIVREQSDPADDLQRT